jgi:hypothetical protein
MSAASSAGASDAPEGPAGPLTASKAGAAGAAPAPSSNAAAAAGAAAGGALVHGSSGDSFGSPLTSVLSPGAGRGSSGGGPRPALAISYSNPFYGVE